MEMTLEQKRAIALANARLRAQAEPAAAPSPAEAVNPAEGMSALERGLVGAGGAMRRAYLGVRSLVPGQDLTPAEKDELATFQKYKDNLGTAGTVGAVGADVLMSMAPAAGAMRAAGAATRGAPLLRQALARGGAELGVGAGYGAATAPEDRGEAAGQGALGAAIGMGVNRAIGGLVKPMVSPEARALAQQGVQPTIGQSVGGAANTMEQKLMSVPIVGDIIRKGRQRALNEFNEQGIRIANPSGQGIGDEALTTAREQIGKMYDTALANMPKITVNQNPIIQATINAADNPALALSDAAKKRVYDYVEKNLLNRSTNIEADVAKRIESDLGSAARNLKSSSTAEDRAIGDALSEVHQQWRQSLTATVNAVDPQAGKTLREADAAWRAFLPLDRAGSYAGSQRGEVPGSFTPRALRRAIEAQDKSQFNNATRAQGAGATPFDNLNRFTRQGEQVLGDTVPDSGTAGRLLAAGGVGGAGYLAGITPELMAGAAATGAAYSRAGTRALTEGIEPAYRAAVQALSLRGVPMQRIDQMLRTAGPQAVIAAARGYALQNTNRSTEN